MCVETVDMTIGKAHRRLEVKGPVNNIKAFG
jgi:hypothetical protein